jgi:hypothetical protein
MFGILKSLLQTLVANYGMQLLQAISAQIVEWVEQRYKLSPNPEKLKMAQDRLYSRIHANPLLTLAYNWATVEVDELIESAVSRLPKTYSTPLRDPTTGRYQRRAATG